MFVEIKEHEDVFYSPCCDEHILDMTRPIKFSANYLQNINLNQVNQIYFGVLDSSKKPNPEYWEIINGYKYISFLIRTDKKRIMIFILCILVNLQWENIIE